MDGWVGTAAISSSGVRHHLSSVINKDIELSPRISLCVDLEIPLPHLRPFIDILTLKTVLFVLLVVQGTYLSVQRNYPLLLAQAHINQILFLECHLSGLRKWIFVTTGLGPDSEIGFRWSQAAGERTPQSTWFKWVTHLSKYT